MSDTSHAAFGVIFDWDGVVVDSSKLHEVAWERFAAERGLALPENHVQMTFGMKNLRIIRDVYRWTNDAEEAEAMGATKEAMFRDIVATEGLPALPGVKQLLEALHRAGAPCVVGSSAPRDNILCVLDTLGFRKYFTAIIAAENVSHGKPDPEVFCKAADAIGLPPSRCVVIEDAQVGIEAALAAGAAALGVTTTWPAKALHRAHRVVASLEEVRVADFEVLLQAAAAT